MVVNSRVLKGPISGLLKKLPEWTTNVFKAWFRFFWRLSVIGKIVVTFIEIIILVLITSSIHLKGNTSHGIVQIGGIALVFVLIFGILFGTSNAK